MAMIGKRKWRFSDLPVAAAEAVVRPFTDERYAAQFGRKVRGILDFTPVGVADGLLEGSRSRVAEYKAGRTPSYGLSALGSAADLVPAAGVAAKAAKGMIGAKKGIVAYHGSPHSFDRFSMDKIGTGEGAQAYGHGLYFAENEAVAKGYRDQLTNGWLKGPASPFDTNSMSGPDGIAARYLATVGSPAEARRRATQLLEGEKRDQVLKAINELEDMGAEPWRGSMYQVHIDADPDDFLDWDKPIAEQSEAVRKAADKLFDPGWDGSAPWAEGWKPTGEDLIGPHRGTEAERRAAILREQGVPGIRYLDQGSRGLDGQEGSRNLVVFDEKLISILKKYGWVPGTAVPAALMAQAQAEVQQGQSY